MIVPDGWLRLAVRIVLGGVEGSPMDPTIEEMCRVVLNYGRTPSRVDLTRWCAHLQGVVQPQLDELEQLKAAKAVPKREKVPA